MSLTLQIGNGAEQELTDLGVSGAVVRMATGGADALELTLPGDVDAAEVLPPFVPVTLRVEGVVRFVGWMDQAPRVASGQSETRTIVLRGPGRFLEDKTFTINGRALVTLNVMIEDGGGNPIKQPALEQIRQILASAKGSSTVWDYDLPAPYVPEARDPLPIDLALPWMQRDNNRCWQAMMAVLEWIPCLLPCWRYRDGAVPLLELRDVDETELHAFSEMEEALLTLAPNPRYDLLAQSAEIIYVKARAIPDPFWPDVLDEAGRDAATAQAGSAADTLGADREELMTFQLEPEEPLPDAGIAEEWIRWWSRLHIDMVVETVGDLRWDVRAGDRLGCDGLLAHYGGHEPVIHEVARDLFYDRVSLRIGSRAHLGLDRMVELARKKAMPRQGGGGGTGAVTWPGGPGGSPPSDEPGEITLTITGPQDEVVPGAYFTIGLSSYASGTTVAVEAGTYRVGWWVPPDFEPPAPKDYTIASGGTQSDIVTATYRGKLVLRRPDGIPAEEGGGQMITIDINDLPDALSPEAKNVKLRPLNVCTPDGIRTMYVLCGAPDEEETEDTSS